MNVETKKGIKSVFMAINHLKSKKVFNAKAYRGGRWENLISDLAEWEIRISLLGHDLSGTTYEPF